MLLWGMSTHKPHNHLLNRTITITSSPFAEDYQNGNAPPWIYSETGFIVWVDEVFLQGFKHEADYPHPDLDEAIEHLTALGYGVVIDQ